MTQNKASKELIEFSRVHGFVFCEEHNIFFPKSLEDEADKKVAELQKKEHFGPSCFVRACPLCSNDVLMPLLRIGRIPEEVEQYRRFSKVGNILHRSRSHGRAPFITLKKSDK